MGMLMRAARRGSRGRGCDGRRHVWDWRRGRRNLCPAAMRISGGQARGIPLLVPKGDRVRPATDGLRQAVFSSVAARLSGAVFLDLFAGSGAYGLEALSRGAAGGVWVERDARTAACLRNNLAAVCKSLRRPSQEGLTILEADAAVAPWPGPTPPDLVFVDPPYPVIAEVGPRLMARLAALLQAHPDPVVVFEMPGECRLQPVGWLEVKRLGKGERQPTVAFFKPIRAEPARD